MWPTSQTSATTFMDESTRHCRILRRWPWITAAPFIFMATVALAQEVHSVVSGNPCDWMGVIERLGFPAFVVVWMLTRSDKRSDAQTEAFMSLVRAIDKLKINCPIASRDDLKDDQP